MWNRKHGTQLVLLLPPQAAAPSPGSGPPHPPPLPLPRSDRLDQRLPPHLKVGLREAARHGDHGGGERARHADGGQELGDVGRQPEGHGPVGVQVARGVVDVEAEVGDVELPRVLEGEETARGSGSHLNRSLGTPAPERRGWGVGVCVCHFRHNRV